MSAMPSSMQADFSAGSLPVKPPMEQSSLQPGGLHHGDFDDGALEGEHQELPERSRGGLVRSLITFCIGVAVTVAWYSLSGPAREMIAGLSPQLAWLAPPAQATAPTVSDAPASPPAVPDQQLATTSVDFDAVRQNVDRIASGQDQIKRSIDQLAAGQEQLTKEIAKLQAVEQYILYKNSEPAAAAARPVTAPAAAARKPTGPMPLVPTAPASPPQTSAAH
jgi:hypothetical protein